MSEHPSEKPTEPIYQETKPLPPRPQDPPKPPAPPARETRALRTPKVPANYQQQYDYDRPTPPVEHVPGRKSRLTAGLLGILLGVVGAHRFYLGYKGLGWVMLLITAVSLGNAWFVPAIWGAVEGVLYLVMRKGYWSVDAKLRPLQW
ncbi:TM2 domain-containing protein [Promicromonospora thailandica]|uniref:TM2 domain-containing membrane protein YozV n=1 Tax=Promicromonospora thailandica TaxID=765201 RepID=A0A9X2JW07_9MICO|nr:TM2 domain-containing protein [Promicromonospora thailandica]MCP2265037.1 TM2 domain-containing membrane protein YozV [Promicromonospora thailandica]